MEFISLQDLYWSKLRASVGNIRRTHRFTFDLIRIWTWDAYSCRWLKFVSSNGSPAIVEEPLNTRQYEAKVVAR